MSVVILQMMVLPTAFQVEDGHPHHFTWIMAEEAEIESLQYQEPLEVAFGFLQ